MTPYFTEAKRKGDSWTVDVWRNALDDIAGRMVGAVADAEDRIYSGKNWGYVFVEGTAIASLWVPGPLVIKLNTLPR